MADRATASLPPHIGWRRAEQSAAAPDLVQIGSPAQKPWMAASTFSSRAPAGSGTRSVGSSRPRSERDRLRPVPPAIREDQDALTVIHEGSRFSARLAESCPAFPRTADDRRTLALAHDPDATGPSLPPPDRCRNAARSDPATPGTGGSEARCSISAFAPSHRLAAFHRLAIAA